MNRLNTILGFLLLIAAGFIVYQNFLTGESEQIITNDSGEKQLYTCGMHPDIISDEPGNCPICEMKLTPMKSKNAGSKKEKIVLYWVAPMDPTERYDSPGKSRMGMDLVPVYEDEVAGGGVVEIDPVTVQNMNVKIHTVKEGKIQSEIFTNGILQIDETKEFHINARTEGWIEKLYVNYTGQEIKAGDKLLEIYSPKLVAAQKEYLASINYGAKIASSSVNGVASGGESLITAAYEKLVYLGMSYPEIFELENSGSIKERVSINSPSSGTVIRKNVVEGQKIKPGEQLFHIANLSNVWVMADIYENEISGLQVGDKAVIAIPGYNGENFNGRIIFIYPTVDNKTHTVKVRIELNNSSGRLKPGMIADVQIEGKSSVSGAIIPESAVIRSGKNNIAVVALGEGKFKPVEISLGMYANNQYQVSDGLAPGMEVVTSAQFLIDSESNLKAALDDFTKKKPEDENSSKTTSGNSLEIKNSDHVHTKESENSPNVEEPTLVRTGIIDVENIDLNKDGKLYECPMDWNVLSDTDGRCPLCEMKLKEYTLNEIKNNLKEHGHEYKN